MEQMQQYMSVFWARYDVLYTDNQIIFGTVLGPHIWDSVGTTATGLF